MLTLLPWWFLVEILALVALPLTLSLLRHLPDRGYPFARVLGVLLPSFLAWSLGMWQLASYGRGLVLFCLVIVATVSGVLLWKDRSILDFMREHWRLILGYEILFALALLVGAVLRIYAPWSGVSIGHTEQPMDFAFLNGIIQSRSLPPQDPWLSGYSINYYYLGYFQAASLTLLSGLPSSITFNLNLALLFALAVTGAFSIAYNLSMASDASTRRRAVVAGMLAILFVVIVGNQAGALQVIAGSNRVVALDAGELGTVLWARLLGEKDAVSLGHTVYTTGDFGGSFDTIPPTIGRQIDDFDWWWTSRVLWDERPTITAVQRLRSDGQIGAALLNWRRYVNPEEIQRSYAITEFPFFSFFLGDMHPHVMSLPVTLLAIALALNVVLAPERGRPALGPARWSWFFLALNAVILGGLYMLNSWDLPTYLLLYGAAWTWRWRQGVDAHWSRQDSKVVARDLGILVGLCLLLYLPMFLTVRSLVGSNPILAEILEIPVLGTIVKLPILSKVLQTIGPVIWDKTSLHTLLILFGLFLYPALSWLIAQRVRRGGKLNLYGWLGIAICLALALLLRFPLLALLPLLWIGWELLGWSRPAESMALLMLLLALLLVLGCEFIYIRDIFENRMNTIFKFYYQVWVLLAITGAWAVAAMLQRAASQAKRRYILLVLWGLPLALLLLGGMVYPFRAMDNALGQERAWQLDGLSDMQRFHPGDYAGVHWLWENAAPDAVVLEAVGPEWGYAGRISAATGRPTLLGWDGHERQWRGGHPEALAELGIRYEEAQRIYQTANPQEARLLLEKYRVDYVFVGSLENNLFDTEAAASEAQHKFAQLGSLVFEAPGVQIYRIEP